MKTFLLPLLAATVTLSGCSTSAVLHPPSSSLRDNVGRVAVVALTNAPQIRYQVPDSRTDVAAERQSFELVTPRMVVNQTGPAYSRVDGIVIGSLAVATPLLVMTGAPVAQEVRRAYGLFVADSPASVASARTAMDAAVTGLRFDEQLRARLASALTHSAPSVGTATSRRNADTVLELMVYEPNLSGSEGINPGLRLSLGLRVRLLDACSGTELYYDYLDYRGPKHTLVTWAAHDAQLFRAEIDRCVSQLSQEIVAQLFTRPANEIGDRATLAAVGIERRPPSRADTSRDLLWSPTRNTSGYARR
jgi:hypothetical protein